MRRFDAREGWWFEYRRDESQHSEGRASRKMIPDPGLAVFQLVYPDNRVGKGTTLVMPLKADKDWL